MVLGCVVFPLWKRAFGGDTSGVAASGRKHLLWQRYHVELIAFLTEKIGVEPDDVVAGNERLSYGMYEDISQNSGERLAAMAPSEYEAIVVQLFSGHPEGIVSCLA